MKPEPRGVEPRIILGVDEFVLYAERAQRDGKWEAWKRDYFEPFRGAFQPMLDVVYQCELEKLKPYVQAFDLDSALRTARRFMDAGGVERVRGAFDRCIEALPPEASFPVYPILGIGHANGMALPAAEPYVFIGMERYQRLERLDGLIAHEYSHLVRVQCFYRGIDPSFFTVGDFTIAEGLATVFALLVLNQSVSAEGIAACIANLGDPKSAVDGESEMRADLLTHWDRPATREMLARFAENGTAYLVGGLMIARLLENGHGICELTRTPPSKLSALLLE
jgi:hypothetical protein